MGTLLRIRADHSLARTHIPGDSVDEGEPFGAVLGGVAWRNAARRERKPRSRVAVGPGITGPGGRLAALGEAAPSVPTRGEPIPV